MSPDQLNALVTEAVGDVEIDTLQVVMLGPEMAEVKARRADDKQWFQGFVHVERASSLGWGATD